MCARGCAVCGARSTPDMVVDRRGGCVAAREGRTAPGGAAPRRRPRLAASPRSVGLRIEPCVTRRVEVAPLGVEELLHQGGIESCLGDALVEPRQGRQRNREELLLTRGCDLE